MSRDRAFRVVADFEAALCEFTGAPYCVTVDSCTNAIFLALKWYAAQVEPDKRYLFLPKHTYVGVVQAARNAGWEQLWEKDEIGEWRNWYLIGHTPVVDAAKCFQRGMYADETLTCLSFQAQKLLPIGRGGAILTDNAEAAEWFRRARLDGRTAGADYKDNTYQRPGFHCYMTPPDAARGLWLLTYQEDDDQANWTEYPDLSEATWV